MNIGIQYVWVRFPLFIFMIGSKRTRRKHRYFRSQYYCNCWYCTRAKTKKALLASSKTHKRKMIDEQTNN